jgi:predicted 2-oxoglutarate/Fe(II)-dependent dioxygenase YbiX
MSRQLTSISPDHENRVWRIESLLSPQECGQLIALAEDKGFGVATVRTHTSPQLLPAIRNNQRVVFEEPHWVQLLWSRLSSFGLPILDHQGPHGLPRALRFYKYTQDQRFKMHKDGAWHEDEYTSKLTLLVYLNEDFSGGATDFRGVVETPKTGNAVLFVHDTWHEGQIVTAGVKYALRSDVLYGPQEGLAPVF